MTRARPLADAAHGTNTTDTKAPEKTRAAAAEPPSFVDAEACRDMADVRLAIDTIDRELVRLIAIRQTYIERAGVLKADRATVRDPARIEDVVAKVLAAAETAGLSREIAEPVWRLLIEQSIAHEFTIYDRKKGS